MLFLLSSGDPRANRGQEQLGGLPSDPLLCSSGHGCLYGLAQPLTYICIYLHRFACIWAVLSVLLFVWLCLEEAAVCAYAYEVYAHRSTLPGPLI